jgi:hypothetical protein
MKFIGFSAPRNLIEGSEVKKNLHIMVRLSEIAPQTLIPWETAKLWPTKNS